MARSWSPTYRLKWEDRLRLGDRGCNGLRSHSSLDTHPALVRTPTNPERLPRVWAFPSLESEALDLEAVRWGDPFQSRGTLLLEFREPWEVEWEISLVDPRVPVDPRPGVPDSQRRPPTRVTQGPTSVYPTGSAALSSSLG